jgi:hypothetical protein
MKQIQEIDLHKILFYQNAQGQNFTPFTETRDLAEKLNEVIQTLNLFIPRDMDGTYKFTIKENEN